MNSLQKWQILKACHEGPYLNSPPIYRDYGVIADDSPESAVIRACFVTGSSEVRIVPIYEYGEIQDG
jgi:hypothetical protein